ncbi:unnamed protein product [Bursaphelenchus okinawaensis]|uniref:F-box domain-containing protein n=1 Tax=Bursaphelenchus okinawaensis TaxID=465554 RepID=A0A811L965_9BILA|nr:unnamed protein product [Bursaphelenchus okinawaensis]CAG9118504.1 unnamed protein product [Bursaphelenchus okinawaensis]
MFQNQFPNLVLMHIIDNVPYMDDVCSFARVNKQFYKIVNYNFKKLCYQNMVYRVKNETWAEAFQFSTKRCLDHYKSYYETEKCCLFTGRIAWIVNDTIVAISNIDLTDVKLKVINFGTNSGRLLSVRLVNRGKTMIVVATNAFLLYDFATGKIEKIDGDTRDTNLLLIKDNIVTDLCTKKTFKLDVHVKQKKVYNVSECDIRRYFGVVSNDNNLILLDNNTTEQNVICKVETTQNLYIIDKLNFVLLLSPDLIKIYDIKNKNLIFEHHGGGKWQLVSNYALYTPTTAEFIVYKKRTLSWEPLILDKYYPTKIPETKDVYKGWARASSSWGNLIEYINCCVDDLVFVDWEEKNPFPRPFVNDDVKYCDFRDIINSIQKFFQNNESTDVEDKIKEFFHIKTMHLQSRWTKKQQQMLEEKRNGSHNNSIQKVV